jgi:EAL domain-containing protein (putative c-di-GMP-specific phosphodiesterase class I)
MRTPGVSHPSATTVEDFRRVLDERSVQPVFQPLIDLDSRHVLGYEALARGPAGSALETPAALFGAAWRAGRVAELDWACRAGAFTEAVRGGPAPWEVVTAVRAHRRATKDLMAEMCMQLEQQGLDAAEPNLLLACFQVAGDFAPVAGVVGADLAAEDLGDDGPDAERRLVPGR